MVRRHVNPSVWAWNFIGFGAMWFLIGSGWLVGRAKVYQIELAEYKLQVGSALREVQKVSDTLEKTAETSAIADQEKRKIQQLTEKSNAVLQQVGEDIEQETEELLDQD